MRIACVGFIVSLLAACGGKSTQAPSSAGDRVAAPETIPSYCEEYRACAGESVQMEREISDVDALAPEPRAEFDAAVAAEIEDCAATYATLTPHQLEWLDACTGCGGSCDVYDCLDEAPQIGDGDQFNCDMDGGGDEDGGDDY